MAENDAAPPPGRLVRVLRQQMALVLVQRATNFALNQALLRVADPEVLGMASVQCELLLSTALFLSREGLRLTLVRHEVGAEARQRQTLVNLSWLSVPLGLALALGVGVSYLALTPDELPERRLAALLYCVGAGLESLVEPLFIVAQSALLTGLRASAEATATLARGVATFLLLRFTSLGVVSFGAAQVIYASVVAGWYLSYFAVSLRRNDVVCGGFRSWGELLPRPVPGAGTYAWLEPASLRLALWFFGQSVFKHLLTEGDRIVLSLGTSLHDQGVYAMAQSYGALAARLLLQPVEEAARLQFSKMAAAQANADQGKAVGSGGSGQQLDRMHSLLVLLLKAVSWLGLVFVSFGVNYTPTLLRILPGERWATPEASATLSWYCIYILTLAVNGTCEAFVFAVAAESQVLSITGMHFTCWCAFAASALPLMARMGTAGVVAANCAVMAARGAFAVRLAAQYLNRAGPPRSLAAALPHPGVLVSFAVAAAMTRGSELRRLAATATGAGLWVRPAVEHVMVGAGLFAAVTGTTFLLEKENVRRLKRELSEARRTKAD